MKTKQFETLATKVLCSEFGIDGISLFILKDQTAKKWYDKHYTRLEPEYELQDNTIYGIYYDSMIQFEIKAAKVENLFRVFLTKFSSTFVVFNPETLECKPNKEKTRERILRANSDRVYKEQFYTTLYGIGCWIIFAGKHNDEHLKQVHRQLSDMGITYSNEYSDAMWVYRFVIGKDVVTHNRILETIKL